MANKTFRKPHNSTKDATGMCLYSRHRKITLWDAKSHFTTKNHRGRGERGEQRGSKVILEGMSVCASDRCQIVFAKNNSVIVLKPCYKTRWVRFRHTGTWMSKSTLKVKLFFFYILMQQTPPIRSNNQIKKQTLKSVLQLQSEAGLVFGKKKKKKRMIVGATGRYCPISHFIGAITVVSA